MMKPETDPERLEVLCAEYEEVCKALLATAAMIESGSLGGQKFGWQVVVGLIRSVALLTEAKSGQPASTFLADLWRGLDEMIEGELSRPVATEAAADARAVVN